MQRVFHSTLLETQGRTRRAAAPFLPGAAQISLLLAEFVTVFVVLRLHLRHELDKFGRLTDAVEISLALESGIKVITVDSGFSQPFHSVGAFAFHPVDGRDVVGGVMI